MVRYTSMALKPLNSSNLERLALKGLMYRYRDIRGVARAQAVLGLVLGGQQYVPSFKRKKKQKHNKKTTSVLFELNGRRKERGQHVWEITVRHENERTN